MLNWEEMNGKGIPLQQQLLILLKKKSDDKSVAYWKKKPPRYTFYCSFSSESIKKIDFCIILTFWLVLAVLNQIQRIMIQNEH